LAEDSADCAQAHPRIRRAGETSSSNSNAVHLRPSRRISREVRVHNLKIEFEFELDFSVSTPAAPPRQM